MAPMGGAKRKRGDRSFSGDGRDDGQRPSPHRPSNLFLGQQSQTFQNQHLQNSNYGQRGGPRRASRGGRGGSSQYNHADSQRPLPPSSRATNASIQNAAASQQYPQPQKPDATKIAATESGPPAVEEKVEERPVPLASTFYEILTEDKIKELERSREDFVNTIEYHTSPAALAGVFDELIRSVISGRLDPIGAGLVVKDIIEQQLAQGEKQVPNFMMETSSLFLDCLSVAFEAFNNTNTNHLLPMLLATSISPQKLRLELDVPLLEKLGLIRSTFGRVGIRQTTNLLYRQSNYNLLREETEGYSKLVTELFTMSSVDTGSGENVQAAFERVKGMIGAFDLDVGRVLDITLDVFAAVLVKQNQFFVKYLRASSWWPHEQSPDPESLGLSGLPRWALPATDGNSEDDNSDTFDYEARERRDRKFWQKARDTGMQAWFELGANSPVAKMTPHTGDHARDANGTQTERKAPKEEDSRMNRSKADLEWARITGTVPPPGNDVAAQVLGFKLRFYSSSARNSQDILPVNLIYLAALLIKIGFLSLRDLYSHLWPEDESMSDIRQRKSKEKAEREKLNRPGGGALNALAAAGALADDTLPLPPRHRDADKVRELASHRESSAKPENQIEKATDAPAEEKVVLPEPSDQKVQLLKSLLSIGAIPEALFMLGRFPWLPEAFLELPEYIHRILHYCLQEIFEKSRLSQPRFDTLVTETTVDDQPAAGKGSPRSGHMPPRRTMRWAQLDKADTGDGIDYKFYWDDWTNNVPICRTTDDVFTLCSTLLSFSGVKIGQDAELLMKLARIGSHSLSVDHSAENRNRWIQLSKRLLVPAISLTKASPGAVAEVYDLIKSFSIETRYSLYAEWFLGQTSRIPEIRSAFDLARAETKDVLKRISKTTVKPMARALAKIALSSPGIVFQVAINQIESYDNLIETVVECARYFTYLGYDVLIWSLLNALQGRGRDRTESAGLAVSHWLKAIATFSGKVLKRYSIMNPVPILRYVINQLRRHNATDLKILESIITYMGGIVSDLNFNESQILAMAGGDLLRAQTLLQLGDRRHETQVMSSSKRLLRALVDPGLVAPLLILIAQERQSCVYNVPEEVADTKLLGYIFDEVNVTLAQLLDLLRSSLPTHTFDELVPSVDSLINDFSVDPSIAFWIGRQSLSAAMQRKDLASSPRKFNGLKQEDSVKDGSTSPEDAHPGPTLEVEIGDPMPSSANTSETQLTKAQPLVSPWHPVLRDLGDNIRQILPERHWDLIGLSFYVTFWTLTLRDMNVPLASYEDEIKKQNSKIDAINSDRTDISISGAQKKEREKKVLTDLQDRLRVEQKEHITAHAQTRVRLQREKEHWFIGAIGAPKEQNALLTEYCFFPRMTISPADSLYAFRLFKYLHSSGTKNFVTIDFLDQVFSEKKLTCMIAMCTKTESENMGRWLGEVLRDLGRWHSAKSVYEKEAYGTKKDLPGFAKRSEGGKIVEFYSYEDFRRQLYKWHVHLNAALRTCLTSDDYMREYNAVKTLQAVSHSFPTVNWMGAAQKSYIEKLTKLDKRPDIQTVATFGKGALQAAEARGWVLPQAFFTSEQNPNVTASTRGSIPNAEAPSLEDQQKTLNPKAHEFQPRDLASGNTDAKLRKPSQGKLGVEDGEIEDEKSTAVGNQDSVPKVPRDLESTANAAPSHPTAASQTPTQVNNDAVSATGASIKSSQPAQDTAANAHKAQSPEPQAPSKSAVSANASLPPRVQHNRNDVETAVESQSPPRTQIHSGAQAPRSNESGRPETIGGRPFDDNQNDRHYTNRTQEAIRERLNRYQKRQEDSMIPDQRSNTSFDRYDTRRASNGVDTRHIPHSQMFDGTVSSQRNGPLRLQQEVIGRPGNFANGHPEANMPPPQTFSSPRQDRNQPNTRQDIAESSQGQGSGLANQRAGVARAEQSAYYGRHSREASPSRYESRRPRLKDEHYSHEPRYPDGQYRFQTGRQHLQSFSQDTRPTPGGSYGQVDGSRDSRNGPADFEPRSQLRRSDGPYSYSDRQDPQYGRLNSGSEAPVGPRSANLTQPPARSTRSTSNVQGYMNGPPSAAPHQGNPTIMMQEQQAPTGPAFNRASGRNGVPPARPEPITTQVSPASDAPDTAGVHPDRLKAIQAISASPTEPSHRRQSSHTEISRNVPPPIPASPSSAPRGPGGQGQSPTGPAQNGRGPPNGPAFGSSRSDKRFAGIQNVLQQSAGPAPPDKNSQGTSIRGRGARIRNTDPSPIDSGPPTPMARPDPPPREDLFAGRSMAQDAPSMPQDAQRYSHGRVRVDARDGFRGDDSRTNRRRSTSPNRDHSFRVPPHGAEGRPFRRDDRRQEPPLPPPEHELRRSTQTMDDRRMPPDRRDGGNWNHNARGGEPPERREDRDRRDGGGSTRKRLRPGDDGPPERVPSYGDKRPRRMQ